jgi:hypothetical protein
LFVEQLLRQQGIVDGGNEIAVALKGEAAFFQLACQPEPAVEANADGEGKPSLDANVAQSEAFMEEVVIEMAAARGFLAWIEEALVVFA